MNIKSIAFSALVALTLWTHATHTNMLHFIECYHKNHETLVSDKQTAFNDKKLTCCFYYESQNDTAQENTQWIVSCCGQVSWHPCLIRWIQYNNAARCFFPQSAQQFAIPDSLIPHLSRSEKIDLRARGLSPHDETLKWAALWRKAQLWFLIGDPNRDTHLAPLPATLIAGVIACLLIHATDTALLTLVQRGALRTLTGL